MRDLAKYSYVNAKIRALLSFLLTPQDFSRLMEAKDMYEALDELKRTPYRQIAESVDPQHLDFAGLEREFLKNDLAAFAKIRDSLSTKKEKDFVLLLMERYELEKVKVALRIWHKKAAVLLEEHIPEGKIHHDIDFKTLLSSQTIEEIILHLDRTPYKTPLMKARDKFKERDSAFYLELALDADYYRRLAEAIEAFSGFDREVSRKIIGIQIDIENISWLIRMRKYYSMGMGEMMEWFIPGGDAVHPDAVRSFYTTDGVTKVAESVSLGPYAKIKELIEENIALLEGFLYQILLRQVKRTLAGFPFTIGTVLGYLILKSTETRNLVSLLYAKNYGWKRQEVEPFLNLC